MDIVSKVTYKVSHIFLITTGVDSFSYKKRVVQNELRK